MSDLVVVTGGGGFIGTNLCRRLAASGVRVRAFGRRCGFPDELGGAEWYQGDFADAAALAAATTDALAGTRLDTKKISCVRRIPLMASYMET